MYREAFFYGCGEFDWTGRPCHTLDECLANLRNGCVAMPYLEDSSSFETIAERYRAVPAPAPSRTSAFPPATWTGTTTGPFSQATTYADFLRRHDSNRATRSVQQAVDQLNNFLSRT